ncbi:MAG TPA: cysteine desulfurase family protein [Mycobacteriales bacterium]|jgi:cysteine desulfurase|nr:cysteine desulfurase family protein [Mycobacteriales bacterium]
MVYLDHAATTPMLPEVLAAMTPFFLTEPGNPSSLHASGRRARRAVEEAREAIAHALGARPSEVVFTGGGTEADNLAVKGLYWARRGADPARTRIVASAVEHHAVLDAVDWLVEHENATVTWLPVDRAGRVSVDDLRGALGDDVALVTVMWANNEVGTVQPVAELAAVAAAAGVPFHTDAVQAVGALPVDFAASGVTALTLTGHKIGGPKGVGALLLRTGVPCVPLLHGGGQERDVRSGTLDTPGIVGLGAAVRIAVEQQPQRASHLAGLRDALVKAVTEAIPDATLNGDPEGRLPGNAHLSFPGCEGDSLLLLLDARGIECSTGSACTAGVARPSHVLLAMGLPEDLARGSLRFSLGHTTTESDVAAVADAIVPVVERARRAGATHAR